MTVALWLLNRFDVADALIGDLLEQRRARRSLGWFAWQVAVAIGQSLVADIRRQKARAVGVAVVSGVAVFIWAESTLWVYLWLSKKWLNGWATDTAWVGRAVFVWWELYGGGLSFVWCVGSGLIGSIAARIYRGQPAAMVVMAALAQLPPAVWWGAPILLRGMRQQVFWVNFEVVGIVILIGMPLSTLIVGLRAAPPISRRERIPSTADSPASSSPTDRSGPRD